MLTLEHEPIIYEIWIKKPEYEVWGTRRQDFQTEQIARFRRVFRFNTSVGRWIVVSDDPNMTTDHAINFARMVKENRIRIFHVDLMSCNR